MEKLLEEALLYDFYGELLTARQKEIYEDFVLNDYSLGEIAADREISRQGVYDIVKRCRRQLEGYESRLQLVEKFLHTRDSVRKIQGLAREILIHEQDRDELVRCLQEIEQLSNEIVETL